MRTRRSPRNQDRLFRELFKPAEPSEPTANEITQIENILARGGFNARTRKMFERDLIRAKHKAAVKRALEGTA